MCYNSAFYFFGKCIIMKLIVKLFPEIIMKSHSVRKRFVKVLSGNIREILKSKDQTVTVVSHWDFIAVNSKDDSKKDELIENLQRISGIHHILEVDEMPYSDLHDIFEKTYQAVADSLENKTFCVRVKRRGKQAFSSLDVMQYVGGGLNQRISSAKVKLKNPDVTVKLEIIDDKLLLIKKRFEGLGGFPMSTQEDVLSLISGGFDSAVASFAFMRRGSRVHYVFFNLGGSAHQIGVEQTAYHLWERYSKSHKVRFIHVDFAPVVAEILQKIDDGQMGVVLKRMMVRAASLLAKELKINALVTGEAMGQVSSQTLTNLQMIDKVSETLILRPLITHDKADIIALAEKIGTADIAKSMPEFCGVISKSPTVKAVEHKLLATEANFNFELLQQAVQNAVRMDIKDIGKGADQKVVMTQTVLDIGDNEQVIDIRTLDEYEDDPLQIDQEVLHIPFYQLLSKFGQLDQSVDYLLYCKKGVMSKLQALYLMDNGFHNVKVLKV